MKKLSVIFFLCCFGIISTAKAQLKPIYSQADYAFWLHLPADSILKAKPPVLIFLHGKSLSGTDLTRVKRYGVISEIEKVSTVSGFNKISFRFFYSRNVISSYIFIGFSGYLISI